MPPPERLTPRQLRLVIACWLMVFTIFGGFLGAVFWKGIQAREANNRTRIAQIQATKQSRAQHKLNAGKAANKKKTMANQIARGTTGQASFTQVGQGTGFDLGSWWVTSEGIIAQSSVNNGAGWNVTPDGEVQVPSTASLGYRSASICFSEANGGTNNVYAFEVVDSVNWSFTLSPPTNPTTCDAGSVGVSSSAELSDLAAQTVNGSSRMRYSVKIDGVALGGEIAGLLSGQGLGTLSAGTHEVSITIRDASTGVTQIQTVSFVVVAGETTRYFCENGAIVLHDVCVGGFATQTLCEDAGCGWPGAGFYCVSGASQQITTKAAWLAAGSPTPRHDSAPDCSSPPAPPTVFWCLGTTIASGTNPPADITTHPSYQACYDAGCHEVVQTTYYWCEDGQVVQSPTRPSENAVGPFSASPDCDAIETPSSDPCAYIPFALTVARANNVIDGDHLELSLHCQGDVGSGGAGGWNNGWALVFHHAIDGVAQPDLARSNGAFPFFHAVTPAIVGVHHFVAALSKENCPPHIAEVSLSVGADTDDDCEWADNPVALSHVGSIIEGRIARQTDYALTSVQHVAPGKEPFAPLEENFYGAQWYFASGAVQGQNTFTLTWTKAGCPNRTQTAQLTVAGEGTNPPSPCPPAFEGDGWYCVANVPTRLATFEAWVAASKPVPRAPSKEACACYVAPPPCANTLSFVSPPVADTVKALDLIVVSYAGNSPLTAQNPVEIFWNGTPLPGVTRATANPRQFFAALPAELGQWQGDVVLSAQLTHASGCKSPLITQSVHVHSTLADDVRWGDFQTTCEGLADAVQIDVRLDEVLPDREAWTYEFAVCSPPPPDSPPPASPTAAQQAELEAMWPRLQAVPLHADEPLLGLRNTDGSYTPPTSEVICRVRTARLWKTIKYPMAAPLTKIRAVDGGLLFYALPFVYRLDATGWASVLDLSDERFELTGQELQDAIIHGGKCLSVIENEFVSVDLDPPDDEDGEQLSTLDTPNREKRVRETRAAQWIENIAAQGGKPASWLRVYGDANSAALYETWVGVDGLETRKRFELNKPIQRVTPLGARFALIVGEDLDEVMTWTRGPEAPVSRFTLPLTTTPPSRFTFARFEGAGDVVLAGTDDGTLYRIAGQTAHVLSQQEFALRDCAATSDGARRALGGDFAACFASKTAGPFLPLVTLAEGEAVTGTETFVQTVVAAQGDPLLGGLPGVFIQDALFVVHSSDADAAHENYILRFQSRDAPPLAYTGSAITALSLAITLEAPKVVASQL